LSGRDAALEQLGPELWVADGGVVSFFGHDYPTRMVKSPEAAVPPSCAAPFPGCCSAGPARKGERMSPPPVHHGYETSRINMHTQNIIERAFELARASTSIDEIRKALRQEGYSNVDAHLGGASIKADLRKQFLR
jgi:hypothetical protein